MRTLLRRFLRPALFFIIPAIFFFLGFIQSTKAVEPETILRQYFLNNRMLIEIYDEQGKFKDFKREKNEPGAKPATTEITACPCPPVGIDNDGNQVFLQECVNNVDTWLASPIKRHVYVPDPDSTAIAQANIRAQQFLDWTFSIKSFYNFDVITSLWSKNQNIALLALTNILIIAALVFLIHQMFNPNFRISVSSIVSNVILTIFLVIFSYVLVTGLAQISDILTMAFRGEVNASSLTRMTQMNVRPQAPTTATGGALESNDPDFNYSRINIVCQNLNISTMDNAQTIKRSINIATITYYVIAFLTLLRIVFIWFLIIIAPLIIVFYPFAVGKKIIESWLMVLAIWLLHGPIMSLTLYVVHAIWNRGIPLAFFTVYDPDKLTYYPALIQGYIGGPSNFNKVDYINNVNQIGSFAEFVVGIVMLWVAIIFPWLIIANLRKFFKDGSDVVQSQLFAVWEQLRTSHTSTGLGATIANYVTKLTPGKKPAGAPMAPITGVNRVEAASTPAPAEKDSTPNTPPSLTTSLGPKTPSPLTTTIQNTLRPANAPATPTIASGGLAPATPAQSAAPATQTPPSVNTPQTSSSAPATQPAAVSVAPAPFPSKPTPLSTYFSGMEERIVATLPAAAIPIKQTLNSLKSSPSAIRDIAQRAGTDEQTIQSVLNRYTAHSIGAVAKSHNDLANTIAKETNLPKEVVSKAVHEIEKTSVSQAESAKKTEAGAIAQALNHVPTMVNSATPLADAISANSHIAKDGVIAQVSKALDTKEAKEEAQQKTQSQKEEVDAVADALKSNLDKPAEVVREQAKTKGVDEVKSGNILTALLMSVQGLLAKKAEEKVPIEDTIPFTQVKPEDISELKQIWHAIYKDKFGTSLSHEHLLIIKGEVELIEAVVSYLLSDVPSLIKQALDVSKTLIPQDVLQTATGEELLAIYYARLKVLREILSRQV